MVKTTDYFKSTTHTHKKMEISCLKQACKSYIDIGKELYEKKITVPFLLFQASHLAFPVKSSIPGLSVQGRGIGKENKYKEELRCEYGFYMLFLEGYSMFKNLFHF